MTASVKLAATVRLLWRDGPLGWAVYLNGSDHPLLVTNARDDALRTAAAINAGNQR